MAVVVVVDLSTDTVALLLQLLLVGPLIAATAATPRQTLAVAVLAVALSVPLGALTDAFGSDRYFVATAVLAHRRHALRGDRTPAQPSRA